jgi:sugar phosphate isomerase/epimerase
MSRPHGVDGTSKQGQPIPELCCKAVDWGFDGIEFRLRRTSVKETPEAYLDLIADSAEAAGLAEVLFGIPTADMTLPDAAARAAEIEGCIRFYEMAKARLKTKFTLANAGAGFMRNPDKTVPFEAYERNGSGCATEEHWEWAAEGYRAIGDAAARLGIRLAFETHMGYLHDTPSASLKLVDRIAKPNVGLNLDFGNIVYFPKPPTLAETIALLGPRILYTHLKNSMALPSGGRIPTALGDGDINHREYLRLLKGLGFTGPIGIEAPRPGDRESFAKPDLAYIRSVMRDLG